MRKSAAATAQPTRLSTKGQLIIPKEIRERHGWTAGTELLVEDRGDQVVLRQARDLPVTTLEDLAGCIDYTGPARSLEDMEAAIARGARERR
jgi:AbrB family looped-hinge helix DNA binding protein